MFLDSFFTISSIQTEEKGIVAHIDINPQHEIFKGHFPDNPITPGVVQVKIVEEILKEHLKRTLKLKKLGRCKFLAIMNPETLDDLSVKIDLEKSEDMIKAKVVGGDKNQVYFKFNATFL